MKSWSFAAAAGIVAFSNAFLLAHVLYNRLGAPDADVVLTQRELSYLHPTANDDDSGVSLLLLWSDRIDLPSPDRQNAPDWLDCPVLAKLGFDCSVAASAPHADQFYERQRARRGYVALEFEGPVWRAWHEAYERSVAEQKAEGKPEAAIAREPIGSHLIAVDADASPGPLRARHPDRSQVIILPAIIGVTVRPYTYQDCGLASRVVGHIQEIPVSIYVPQPFSGEFTRHSPHGTIDRGYRVHLRYGALLEPWVTAVEIQ